MNKKGSILILSIFVIAILMILGVTLLSQSISEHNLAERYLNSTHAFWAAEAGVNRAIEELRSNYSQCGVKVWFGTLSSVDGGYEVDVACVGEDRNITVRGFVPAVSPQTQRVLEAVIRKEIPTNFYDNAVYSAGDVDLNGTSYSITGDVIYADTIDNPDNITEDVTQDPSIAPLALLDFEQLLTISQSQGNFYDEDRLDSGDSFPISFWFLPPDDSVEPPIVGIPNIVYVTEDLELKGNIGTVGGFFVVVGDVITSPDDVEDATINGNGQIEGMIYTRGEFRINGGGGNLTIDGAIWAGEEVRLNGNAHIAFNQDYMTALETLDIDAGAQVVSWREQVNPYSLTP